MSINNTEIFQNYYSPLVKAGYMKSSLLKGLVRTENRIVGNQAFFRKYNSIQAIDLNKGADITYAGTEFENATAILKDKGCFDLLFDVDKPKFNFDEASILANNTSMAIGRAIDQTIINDGLNQTSTQAIGGESEDLTVDLLLKVSEVFNRKAVPSNERYIVHTASQLTQLLKNTEITSGDYNNIKTLVSGEVNTFLGFKFICIEDRKEGGLPTIGNGVKAFAFHKDAVGHAISQDVKSLMERVPEKLAYQIGAIVQQGAVNIDDDGIVPIITKANN